MNTKTEMCLKKSDVREALILAPHNKRLCQKQGAQIDAFSGARNSSLFELKSDPQK